MSNTRAKIINTLSNLFKSNTQVSVTLLASESGVSRSSLYKYYPDIIAKLKADHDRKEIPTIELQGLKLSILRQKLEEQRDLVTALTRICSEQMIEISELNARLHDEKESKDLKIAFLESQLAKGNKPKLKTVK
ncbi:TetR/AcrR family transcriptional regulator [Pseudomonas sp. A1230]|uniref:TetR/AcrR family transcriptional regulator n=1 Tax=Pseudomonas sp. A1230 TaxID=3235106 RepID=UPI003783D763